MNPGQPAYRFLYRMGPRLRRHQVALSGAAVLILLSIATGLAFPLVVRELLDAVFLASDCRMPGRIAIFLMIHFFGQAVVNFGQSYLAAAVSRSEQVFT